MKLCLEIHPHLRLGQYFLKEAKKKKTVGLATSLERFFKSTGGVLARKTFLPPKQAKVRKVGKKPKSKACAVTLAQLVYFVYEELRCYNYRNGKNDFCFEPFFWA